ncbi:hypothetical protein [Telmatospirillum siberiense]|uniref:hypothetical protein n=1 Tax=Telmatospirillum siberiense TaxID=382514 RepID=UPI0011AFBB28|nr:hypothetical protein [Telmatospirillum siberiense]
MDDDDGTRASSEYRVVEQASAYPPERNPTNRKPGAFGGSLIIFYIGNAAIPYNMPLAALPIQNGSAATQNLCGNAAMHGGSGCTARKLME